MKFRFVPMNLDYANEMINTWKYPGEYKIYDYSNEMDNLFDEEIWGLGKFAALDEKNNLVGEFTIEFFEEEDEDSEDGGFVEYKVVKDNPQNIYEMWVGWGLRPDLCGKGLGLDFVNACVQFAVKRYNYRGEYIRCGVTAFNERAIKVYKKAGFEAFRYYKAEEIDEAYDVMQMQKKLV